MQKQLPGAGVCRRYKTTDVNMEGFVNHHETEFRGRGRGISL